MKVSDKDTKDTLAQSAKTKASAKTKNTSQRNYSSFESQRQRILDDLRKRKSRGVSTFRGRGPLGSPSIAARIFELKSVGHSIDKHWVKEPDQNHIMRRIACYVLLKEAQ